jgi:UDP-N-acetylmuramyl tripeptide synthase
VRAHTTALTSSASGKRRAYRWAKVTSGYDRGVAIAGHAVGMLARFTHLGAGTALPGRLVQALDHGFLARRGAALSEGSVVVSGTNGKTTTASMIQAILQAEGVSFVSNRSGSNLRGGVASAFVFAPSDARFGVFEVDEAALPLLVAELRPRMLVLMNVFRDQLDRFPEPDRVLLLLRHAAEVLPSSATIVANADDPHLWAALEDLHPIGFSVARETAIPPEADTSDSEPGICFRCGGRLRFLRRTMANLGSARCAQCGWRSAEAEYVAELVAQAGVEASVFEVCGEIVTLPLGGVHNAYNAVAALAATAELGIEPVRAVAALESFQARFGRGEEMWFEDRHLWLGLIKNPAGAGPVVGAVCADRRVGAVVVAVSDRDADGRDISWIWDADLEQLALLEVPIVAAGTRAADTAVRMKYAGSAPQAVETEPLAAVRAAAERCSRDRIVAVLATYTAMLDVREGLIGDRTARVEDGLP